MDLLRLVEDFKGGLVRDNPVEDDTDTILALFLLDIKSKGYNVASWTDSDWYDAVEKLGFSKDDAGIAVEQVSTWGVDG